MWLGRAAVWVGLIATRMRWRGWSDRSRSLSPHRKAGQAEIDRRCATPRGGHRHRVEQIAVRLGPQGPHALGMLSAPHAFAHDITPARQSMHSIM